MIIFRKLVEFELSRFSTALPGLTKRGIQIAFSYFLILIAASLYVFKGIDAPEIVFAVGVTLGCTIVMSMAMFHMLNFWGQSQREWWLTLPHPRIILASAKAWGLMLAGLRMVFFDYAGMSNSLCNRHCNRDEAGPTNWTDCDDRRYQRSIGGGKHSPCRHAWPSRKHDV